MRQDTHRGGKFGGNREAMLSLSYAAPGVDLRDYISSYYLFRANLPEIGHTVHADLPQLRFLLAGTVYYTFVTGDRVTGPEAMLTRSTTAVTPFNAKGPPEVFGVGI